MCDVRDKLELYSNVFVRFYDEDGWVVAVVLPNPNEDAILGLLVPSYLNIDNPVAVKEYLKNKYSHRKCCEILAVPHEDHLFYVHCAEEVEEQE